VERHSGVLHAEITIAVSDEVMIVITDEGIGPGLKAQERFGVRNTVRANLEAIGGSATLSRGATGGTEVILHAPLTEPLTSRIPTFPVLGVADSTLWGRIGVTGTNIFMLIITPIIIGEFPSPALTAVAITAYVACMLAIALLWTSKFRQLLMVVGIILLPLPFFAAGNGSLTCVAAPGSQGIITGMAGGGVMLLLITAPRVWMRVGISAIALASSIWLAQQLPDACEQEALLSAGVTAIYMLAITVVLAWIDLRFDARRASAQLEWERLLDERVNRERRAAEESSWTVVAPSTRALLEEIATGDCPINDAHTQMRATTEAESLRARIGLTAQHSHTLDHLSQALSRAAQEAGTTIEIASLITGKRDDPLPPTIIEFIDRIIRTTRPSTMTIRTIIDGDWEEFVIVIPETQMPEKLPVQTADVVTDMDTDEGSLHISLRRPAQHR
jgi:hypothetical protein